MFCPSPGNVTHTLNTENRKKCDRKNVPNLKILLVICNILVSTVNHFSWWKKGVKKT